MSGEQDFERVWLAKFSRCLDAAVGEQTRKEVMEGSEALSSQSNWQKVVGWSKGAMQRLDALVDEATRRQIMTGCACQYPKSALQEVRRAYAQSGDVDLALQILQEQFVSLLKDSLGLSDELIEDIVSRGWGSAGVREGDTINATKIPKSGKLAEYMQETDPEKKRQLYCHCPRVRDALKTGEIISLTYCYCGAGFYKGIWEEILQQTVQVEVLESVLDGGEVCKIAVRLPPHR